MQLNYVQNIPKELTNLNIWWCILKLTELCVTELCYYGLHCFKREDEIQKVYIEVMKGDTINCSNTFVHALY
jgi:hypothetical protein